jgi:hypothetical protein
MSTRNIEFILKITSDNAVNICKTAIAQMNWRIMNESSTSITFKEAAVQVTSFTWPAEITVKIKPRQNETVVSLYGSIFAFGPIQAGHLEGQMGRFKNLLEVSANQIIQNSSSSQKKEMSLSNEIERLAELHKKGILTDVEFKNAKEKLIGL